METGFRVMHLIDSTGIYGAEKMLLHLMEEQAKLGCVPILGSIAEPGVEENVLEQEAVRRQLRIIKLRMRRGIDPGGIRRLLEAADRSAIDLFHVHGYKGTILLGLLPRNLRKRPVIRTIHGRTSTTRLSKLWLYEMLDLWLLRRMDAVVSVMPGAPATTATPSRRYAIANGIPPAALPQLPPDSEQIGAFCRGAFVIGAIGRLSAEKSFADLLHALARLSAGPEGYKVIILGEGPRRAELEEIISRQGLRDKVLLPGYREDAARYFPFFDLLAIPSRTEGLPLVLLEAMQAGLPVVATRVGGIPRVLEEGRCGRLIPPGDPNLLALAIAELREHGESTALMASRARQAAMERYTSTRMAEEYARVYGEVMQPANPGLALGA